jgi:pyridoxal phosphate enzyme (YggS family)
VSDISENIRQITKEIPAHVTMVAVSKTHPVEKIREAYQVGQRDFGENKVQEMLTKYAQLPKDIRWHLIGHLQTNKVKSIIDFVYLIHAVDSIKLLSEIEKRAQQSSRRVQILLQMHIAEETTKFGLDEDELNQILAKNDAGEFPHVEIRGLMGMATFTKDHLQVKKEFEGLNTIYKRLATKYNWSILSMGMSGDYPLAIAQGSNLVRVGSAIFGERNYQT